FVRDLLTPQVYPDMRLYPGGPPKRPYDITGWTLNYQMGVKVDRVMERVAVATDIVDVAALPSRGELAPRGAAFALDPRANDSFTIVNRLLKAGDAVFRATAALNVNSVTWPPGAFLVTPSTGTTARVVDAVRSLGVAAGSVDEMPRDVLL